jgi:hypothetical protein
MTLIKANILARKPMGRNIRNPGPITGRTVESGEILVVEVIVFHAHAALRVLAARQVRGVLWSWWQLL